MSEQLMGQSAEQLAENLAGQSTEQPTEQPTGQRLPNLVIAGTVKGGTTSLWTYLAEHPDICSSSVKETCYFSVHRYGQWDSRYEGAVDPFAQFQEYFCHCAQQKYVMEATPGDFPGGERLAKEIKQTLGDTTKVIIVLRNPVNRFVSFWKYKKSMLELESDLTLKDYVARCQAADSADLAKAENSRYYGLKGGCYADHMDEWFQVFGDSLKILFFDDLKQDSRSFLADISAWLGIDDSYFDTVDLSVQNKSVGYKNVGLQKIALLINTKAEKFWRANQSLKNALRRIYYLLNAQPHQGQADEATLRQLEEIYAPYNQKLAAQLRAQAYERLPNWLEETS